MQLIEKIKEASTDSSFGETDQRRLANFCKIRWPQIAGSPSSE
jgi:hypothetical protein